MAANIPTPEEIARVTEYLQSQAISAQEAAIEVRQAMAVQAQAAADALVNENNVVGVVISRKPWSDENLHWSKRGAIQEIRLDFADGQQAIVSVSEEGDSLDLRIVPAG